MNLAELATHYEALSRTARPRGLAGAALATREAVETALGPHRRTGVSADTLTVTATPTGLAIDGVRYLPFIKGIPKGDALRDIAVEGYNAAATAALRGGS